MAGWMRTRILVQDAWIAVKHSKKFRKTFVKVSRKHGVKIAVVANVKLAAQCGQLNKIMDGYQRWALQSKSSIFVFYHVCAH